MVSVEVTMAVLMVLWLFILVFVMLKYWDARQDARLYKQWYDDMCMKWTREMPMNKEEEDDYR